MQSSTKATICQPESGFDHLEVGFRGATFGTLPVLGYILPASARFYALPGVSFCFVIFEAADNAYPGFQTILL